ncbi:helix-turn-helix domain-containing protein [Mucilaginibacter rubeus]|uniref:helix-turn-helix domain-containing protein n=1 Tax=Mucilaginibacter rubeus TaxID=2027860 RepID=UPI001669F497|nr:helix-turn-helix transcriptional regulator [Mucilaginibacter rubeus]
MTLPIGEKIRLERLAKQYSQEYMAWSLDISQAAYSKVERDETELTIRRIYQIAEILEISPFRLMPKPKYGTAIVGEYLWKMVAKIRGLFRKQPQNRTPSQVL